MINRILIRVKVVQNIYSYLLTKPDRTLQQAVKELERSLDLSYDLYFYLLRLTISLTDLQESRLDEAKHKYLATKEDLEPNTKFVDNQVVRTLRNNDEFIQKCDERHISWNDEPIFLRLMLDKVLRSEIYREYMEREGRNSEEDFELWRQLLKKVLLEDPDFEDKLETMSANWCSEDVDVMGQFAIKTLRTMASGDLHAPILPKFKDEEDEEFSKLLFTKTIDQTDSNNEIIDNLLNKGRWDKDRIALMDRIVMSTAITEMRNFLNIPPTVTINEYIDLAKVFSTPHSGQFVNGILDAAAKLLRPDYKNENNK